MIPYGRQTISESDIQAVVDVLHSDWLTQGPAVPRFEKAVADYCGADYAVAVGSATSALHLACLALDVGEGDIVWTSPNTFVASANCARYCGAKIDFVDIDPFTYNISTEALKAKLTEAASTGKLPKVLISVHFAGQPCDMAVLHELSIKYGFRIIEDASHAIGATYLSELIGSGRYSDITVFSFHPVKIITTGEGGMALTNKPELAERMSRLRSHGITRDARQMDTEIEGAWYYQQIDLGYNYRMTDIQAALGFSQLQRLNRFLHSRRSLASRYNFLLCGLELILPHQFHDRDSSWHLYVIGWNEERSGISRAEAFHRLRENGIGVNVHYIPVHLQPYYRQFGFKPGQFPNSEAYYSRAISLPIFPGLTEERQDWIVGKLSEMLAR